MSLLPHQERVVDEKTELDIRREKLRAFMEGDIYRGLDDSERMLLVRQLFIMGRYSEILGQRIVGFRAAAADREAGNVGTASTA